MNAHIKSVIIAANGLRLAMCLSELKHVRDAYGGARFTFFTFFNFSNFSTFSLSHFFTFFTFHFFKF